MPSFKITAPDGTSYDVNAPEGTTQEQALARVQATHAARMRSQAAQGVPQAPQSPAPIPTPQQQGPSLLSSVGAAVGGNPAELGKYIYQNFPTLNRESLKSGIKDAALNTFLAPKKLLMGESPEDEAVLAESKKAVQEGGTQANVAKLLTQAATYMIPGMQAQKGISAGASALLPNSPMLAKALALVGGGGATSAAQEALSNADASGKDIAMSGATGAGLAGALGAAGRVATGMFTPSKDTVDLAKKGIVPTLAQGAESGLGRFIGGTASGVVDTEKRTSKEVVRAWGQKYFPEIYDSHMANTDLNDAIKPFVASKYDALFPAGRRVGVTNAEKDAVLAAVRGKVNGTVPPAEVQSMVNAELQPIFANSGTSVGANKIKYWRDSIQSAIDRYSKSGASPAEQLAKDSLIKAKDTFDNLIRTKGMTAEQVKQLEHADELFGHQIRFNDLMSNVNYQRELPAKAFAQAYEKANNTGLAASTAPQRDLFNQVNEVLGDSNSHDLQRAALNFLKKGTGLAAAMGVAGPAGAIPTVIGAAGQTREGAKALMGLNPSQKALAEAIRKLKPEQYTAPLGADIYDQTQR